jgi:hypothetical protein
LIGGTIAAFLTARRREQHLLSIPKAFAAWLFLFCLLLAPFFQDPDVLWLAAPILAGLLALSFSPLATAPLAMALNRHR